MGDGSSLVVLFAVQAIAAIMLVIVVWRGGQDKPPPEPRRDDPGGGLHVPSAPRRPRTPSGSRLPLPDAAPSGVRIRDHTRRLADRHRPPRRRMPQHDPARRPPVRR